MLSGELLTIPFATVLYPPVSHIYAHMQGPRGGPRSQPVLGFSVLRVNLKFQFSCQNQAVCGITEQPARSPSNS